MNTIQYGQPESEAEDSTPVLSKSQRAELLAQVAARHKSRLVCPVCRLPASVDQANCLRCGADLLDPNSTNPSTLMDTRPSLPQSTGDAILTQHTTIVLQIGAAQVSLPNHQATIGRRTSGTNALLVDVDLEPYGAWEAGVSRLHVGIRRKGPLAYLVDLGSSNGTYLNGHRLQPGVERLLRNGDHLQLSQLSIQVKFKVEGLAE